MPRRRKRVGVFGGAFDPPHMGHLLAAVYARKVFALDEIWFVPAYRHAFGKKMAPFPDRLAMLRLLLEGMDRSFRVSPVEKSLGSRGKTLETLEAFRRRHPNRRFLFVAGSDTLEETPRWHRFDAIEKRFGVLIVPRRKGPARDAAIPNISSRRIRRGRGQAALRNWLPPAVAAYAARKRLYR